MRAATTYKLRTQPDFAGESSSNRSVSCALPFPQMTQDDDIEQIGDSFWAGLAARVLHPAQVEIIEALKWIDRPLAATDLLGVFEGQRAGSRLERHLRQLTRLGAVAPDDNGKARGPMGQVVYRPVRQPRT